MPFLREPLLGRSPDRNRSSPGVDAGQLGTLVLAVARHRDREAFATLFRHFAPRLLQHCLRLGADRGTAEELVQDVMLTVWLKADSFNPALQLRSRPRTGFIHWKKISAFCSEPCGR